MLLVEEGKGPSDPQYGVWNLQPTNDNRDGITIRNERTGDFLTPDFTEFDADGFPASGAVNVVFDGTVLWTTQVDEASQCFTIQVW